jgi:hypothetical protein
LAPVGTISFLSTPRSDFLPGVALAFGAALWGLFWIPIRGIEQAGVADVWTGSTIFGASTLLFIPLLVLWQQGDFSGVPDVATLRSGTPLDSAGCHADAAHYLADNLADDPAESRAGRHVIAL